jgi:hypothetical protein
MSDGVAHRVQANRRRSRLLTARQRHVTPGSRRLTQASASTLTLRRRMHVVFVVKIRKLSQYVQILLFDSRFSPRSSWSSKGNRLDPEQLRVVMAMLRWRVKNRANWWQTLVMP